MFKQNKTSSAQRVRNGLTSHILLQKGDIPGDKLSITWVDVAPGSAQGSHKHAPEQIYVIIKGHGRMHVGGEQQEVIPGDMIYIPPNVLHHIGNISTDQVLAYISAATPAFDIAKIYDTNDFEESHMPGN